MRLTQLREHRETEIYLKILNTLNEVIGELTSDKKMSKLFSDAVVIREQRPWGIKDSLVNVWVVSLNAVLKNTPENKLHRKGRQSIFSMVDKRLPPMPFPFTVDLLKDAVRLYMSPYGQVADTEQVMFPSCDCINGPKNKPSRHDPCKKPSVVLAGEYIYGFGFGLEEGVMELYIYRFIDLGGCFSILVVSCALDRALMFFYHTLFHNIIIITHDMPIY